MSDEPANDFDGAYDGADDETFEMDRDVPPTGELPKLVQDEPEPKPKIRPIRFTIKILLLIVAAVFLLPNVLSGFRQAAGTVRDVNPALLVLGFGLQLAALFCYSLLTRASLGTAGHMLSPRPLF